MWTAEDRDKAIAYEIAQAEACPSCGTRKEDWTDAGGRLHDPPLLEPIIERCDGCAERARLRVHFEEEVCAAYGNGEAAASQIKTAMAGHYVVLAPFDPYRDVKPDGGGD